MFRIGTKLTSFGKIFDLFEKIHEIPREVISGRNFILAYDSKESPLNNFQAIDFIGQSAGFEV